MPEEHLQKGTLGFCNALHGMHVHYQENTPLQQVQKSSKDHKKQC